VSHAFRLPHLFWLLGLGACTSVLGIDDLHDGPRPGSGGDENTAATGNDAGQSNATAGKTNNGGKTGNGGTLGESGAGNPMAGTGNEPSGGTGAEGGEGGALNPEDPTVRGHLIDIWGHELADVPVQIGDTLTTTDANGAFVIENVPAIYDVSFDIEFDLNIQHRSFGWVYQGLTRRDPTLQAKWGLPLRSGQAEFAAPGVTFAADEKISLTIGGVDGNTDTTLSEGGYTPYGYWEGNEPTSSGVAHALYWHYDHDTELPTAYYGYTSSSILLNENETAKLALTLTKGSITAGNLLGTVTPTGSDRSDQVWVHFTNGALMRLINATGANTFSYLVPTLPKSSITVAASEGDPYWGECGIVVADGLAASSKPALTIPKPVKLTAPADDSDGVTAATVFSFSTSANAGPYVVQFTNVDASNDAPFQTIFVVTAKSQLSIPPVIGGGMKLKANNLIEWRVATHGKHANVDEMAGPGGGLQPFADYDIAIDGIVRDGGEFTMSSWRHFMIAP